MESRAILRNVWISPQKARLVANMIRGKSASEAITILTYTRKKAAAIILKLLESAIANAEHEAEQKDMYLDVDELVISTIFVDKAQVHRRFRPRARGMYNRVKKHTSHITIKLQTVAFEDDQSLAQVEE